jgi:DNA-binding response OmpR family regulator/DNA-binding CsgD family transcriptional regulator
MHFALDLAPTGGASAWSASAQCAGSAVVLIIDDSRETAEVLADALEESGYTVRIATQGLAALQLVLQIHPQVILLNAVISGMDGFEVARRLKSLPGTANVPIIFMTGLNDTDHVLEAFSVGAADCVVKPVHIREVIARIQVHTQSARRVNQASHALDAFGYATLVVNQSSAVVWQTPLACDLMQRHFGVGHRLSERAMQWVHDSVQRASKGVMPPTLTLASRAGRLNLALHEKTGDSEWLVVMRECSDEAVIQALVQAFKLTTRQAEVLYWVAKGKTNRDIGDIFGTSHMTVKKHLEHVFKKLGVETRNAAASIAASRVRGVVEEAQPRGLGFSAELSGAYRGDRPTTSSHPRPALVVADSPTASR